MNRNETSLSTYGNVNEKKEIKSKKDNSWHYIEIEKYIFQNLPLITAWLSNYIYYEVQDEITHSFLDFNGATVEVWEWISNFTSHFAS